MNRNPYQDIRRNKYGVAPKDKRTWNDMTYDSRGEMLHGQGLHLRLRAGDITDLTEQKTIYLTRARLVFILDFHYREDGRWVFDEWKGAWTERFRILVQLWPFYGPDAPLRIITRAGNGCKIKTIEGRRHDGQDTA